MVICKKVVSKGWCKESSRPLACSLKYLHESFQISYFRFAVFEAALKHSSLDRILWEKYFPSGSSILAMV